MFNFGRRRQLARITNSDHRIEYVTFDYKSKEFEVILHEQWRTLNGKGQFIAMSEDEIWRIMDGVYAASDGCPVYEEDPA